MNQSHIPRKMENRKIQIDVQGTKFLTYYNTLIKIPYFETKIKNFSLEQDLIFVDRPAHIFKHILGAITDKRYRYPYEYRYELDFYGIDRNNINFTGHEVGPPPCIII